MTWRCPNCSREFRNTNQWHSCEQRELSDHLAGKSETVLSIFGPLHDTAIALEGVRVSPSKTSVQYRVEANFLSLRLKSRHVEMEFQLPDEDPDFPVTICKRVSSNRVWHQALLEDANDIDGRVLGWIRASYELITGRRSK